MKKRSSALTPQEKKDADRVYLKPLPSTLAETPLYPTTLECFSSIAKKAILPSPLRPKEAK